MTDNIYEPPKAALDELKVKRGEMTLKQSFKLWWSIFWRTLLIGVLPTVIINFLPSNAFSPTVFIIMSFASQLFTILVLIAVLRYVINNKTFKDFRITIEQK